MNKYHTVLNIFLLTLAMHTLALFYLWRDASHTHFFNTSSIIHLFTSPGSQFIYFVLLICSQKYLFWLGMNGNKCIPLSFIDTIVIDNLIINCRTNANWHFTSNQYNSYFNQNSINCYICIRMWTVIITEVRKQTLC